MDSEAFAFWIRRAHIAVGFVGLFFYWVAALSKKGGRVHILSGRVFEWCGYYVATSAIFACLRYLTIGHHFAFIDRPYAEPSELMRVQMAQFLLTLLAFLAWIFLFQLRNGVRITRTLRLSAEAYRNWEATFWLYSHLFAAIWLGAYGAYRLATGGSQAHIASIVVAGIVIGGFKSERQFYLNPREEKMSWWYKHMECMLGCGVAFHTAGLLFTTRWLERTYGMFEIPNQLEGLDTWLAATSGVGIHEVLRIAPWILPTLIGAPLTWWWIGRYRNKFGDGKSTPTESTLAASK